jgi:hypothetical protein
MLINLDSSTSISLLEERTEGKWLIMGMSMSA